MAGFSKLGDRFRDHTRDNICIALQRLGISAQLAARGQPEERVYSPITWSFCRWTPAWVRDSVYGSLGVIEVTDTAIRWVNVKSYGGEDSDYYIDHGVPDPRIEPRFPKVRVNSIRVRTRPLIGMVDDLRWERKDFGLGIVDRLNGDTSLKGPIIGTRDVEIRVCRGHVSWVLSTGTPDVPSRALWDCYQAIAQHLRLSMERAIGTYYEAILQSPQDAEACYNQWQPIPS